MYEAFPDSCINLLNIRKGFFNFKSDKEEI